MDTIEEYKEYLKPKSVLQLKQIIAGLDKNEFYDRYQAAENQLELLLSQTNNDEAKEEISYAGFWRRLGAFFLDAIIMSPISYLVVLGSNYSKNFQLYYFLPGLAFGLWYSVYLVMKYGGTPGKLLMKIRITDFNGANISFKSAFIRHSVLFLLSIPTSIAMIITTYKMPVETYHSLTWTVRYQVIASQMPSWQSIFQVLTQIWLWSEFIVLLTNKKRRALHDFMAGTIVIKKYPSRPQAK